MNWHKLGLRFNVEAPEKTTAADFIPVFHRWIQGQVVEDHLLIDVHDYSHVQDGPGVLLVAHEGQFSLNLEDGQPAFFYVRKRPLEGSPEECLRRVFKTTLSAASMLEREGIAFKDGQFDVLVNDRLNASTAEDAAQLETVLSDFLGERVEGAEFSVTHSQEPTQRLTLRVESSDSNADIGWLLARLA